MIDWPMLEASLVRASRGWTYQSIQELPVHDFWVWIGGFNRHAEEERKANEAAMKKEQ